MISWRNPGPEHRDWSLDHYVGACIGAAEVTAEIAGSPDANVTGFCAGGMTQSAMLAHLAATGRDLVHASTLAVTTIDTEAKSVMTMFVSQRTADSAIARSARKGMLEGRSLAVSSRGCAPTSLSGTTG